MFVWCWGVGHLAQLAEWWKWWKCQKRPTFHVKCRHILWAVAAIISIATTIIRLTIIYLILLPQLSASPFRLTEHQSLHCSEVWKGLCTVCGCSTTAENKYVNSYTVENLTINAVSICAQSMLLYCKRHCKR